MRKILYILLFLLIYLSGKSQSVKDSTVVCVPYGVAKQITKDLLTGDSAKAMLAVTYQELDLVNQKVSYKDSIILNQRLKEINLLSQIKNKDIIIENKDKLYAELLIERNKLARKLTWSKTKTTLSQIGAIAIAGTAAYFHFFVPKR